MDDKRQLIQSSIIADMSEGVMVIRFDGVIDLVNDAALSILGRERDALLGRSFAQCFFSEPDNDAFTQSVLDAVYDKRRQDSYVPYRTPDGAARQLRIVSSYLRDGEAAVGVILVISDITELEDLRDAIRAMERIRALNDQLELRNRLLKQTFGRYLSDDIVREILESPDGLKLGGQKRTLTVMMSDLRGFTAMCERMEPEALITMLNHYFSEMYEEIARYNGTLVEFMGDGLFIIFGAPRLTQRHASDAVACAVAMQKKMADVNAWNRAHGYEPLRMGVGINTDAVILGNIGSEKRTKYGVLGAAVNLAGRIESYSTEGQVLISPTTRTMIPETLAVSREFTVSPKGVAGEITITAVHGIGAPYCVEFDEPEEAFRTLSAPVETTFYALDGKHVSAAPKRARLLAVSDGGAILETGEHIDLFDNLRLDIGGEFYAKAVAAEKGRFTLRFTATPPDYEAILAHLK